MIKKALRDWLIQRVTAVILVIYVLVMTVFFVTTPQVSFLEWQTLFAHPWMKGLTLLTVISTAWHAWLGLWIVLTDYVKNLSIRLALQTIIIILLLGCIIWTFRILWGFA